jgi:hypothetical protein
VHHRCPLDDKGPLDAALGCVERVKGTAPGR